MSPDQMEALEKTAFSMVTQALTDYSEQATDIFSKEVDQPQDIAEDVTREAIEAMGLPQLHIRLYGKVDVKKAIYAFLPEAHQLCRSSRKSELAHPRNPDSLTIWLDHIFGSHTL